MRRLLWIGLLLAGCEPPPPAASPLKLPSLEELRDTLRENQDPDARRTALNLLAAYDAPVQDVLLVVEYSLNDPDEGVRCRALDLLHRMHPLLRGKPESEEVKPTITLGALGKNFDGKPSTSNTSAWPHFLGPDYDGVSRERVPLAETFPAAGPKVLWTVATGDGYGGTVVRDGRAYFLDYDPDTMLESLRCVSLDDGREIWRRGHEIKILNYHGYTHSTPTVGEGAVAVVGPRNCLMVAEPTSGRLLWSLDLDKTFNLHASFRVQSPLIDGKTLVLATGGRDIFLAAFDLRSGNRLWSLPNPGKLELSLSSIVPRLWKGDRIYVYRATGGILGVSTSGKLLWKEPCALSNYSGIPAPVAVEKDQFLLASGYGAGSRLILPGQGDVWKKHTKEGLGSEAHLTPPMDGHVFGVAPADAGPIKNQLVCMDLKDGRIVWSSGPKRRFGNYAPVLLADGKLFIHDDQGRLNIARARTDRYEELASGQIGQGDWSSLPSLAGGLMILRERKRLVCVDLR